MNEVGYWTIIILLGLIIIVQGISHKQERTDLYNRIMAKDLPEYKGKKPGTVKNILRKNFNDRTPK
jgi:lipopolysaccharide export system protein LptC